MSAEQGRELSEEIERERPRLRNFIRRRIANEADVEDILQDVFSELIEAYQVVEPIEQVGAWLYRVARNRIVDRFRRRRSEGSSRSLTADVDETDDALKLDELLPSAEAGPEAVYVRAVLLEELEAALDELPVTQRQVFIAHEIEGRSFKDLAAETGLSVNTLLSRKRYAVLHLRERLQSAYDEFNEQ